MTRIVGVILAGEKELVWGRLPIQYQNQCSIYVACHYWNTTFNFVNDMAYKILLFRSAIYPIKFNLGQWMGQNGVLILPILMKPKPLGTAGAFPSMKLDPYDHALIIYGDVYMNINFERLIQFHTDHQAMRQHCAPTQMITLMIVI